MLPGTVLSASVVAVVLVAAGALPFGPALPFGAMISATDPVAVIAVFRHAAVPARVKALVEAESLANDGVAVVLYAIALTVAQGIGVDWPSALGHEFWRSGAYIANAAVFLATGLLIDIPRAIHEPLLVAAAVFAVLLTRAALAFGAGRDRAARITIFLAGMRGALPLALALALPDNLANRAVIIDGVFAVVLVTLVIQDAALEPVVTRLYGKADP